MRLKLKDAVVIAGHPGLRVGDIFESADRSLLQWCEEVPAVAAPAVAEVVTREPVVENRDPAPKRFKKTLP